MADSRLLRIRDVIRERLSDSRLSPLTPDELASLRHRYPGCPAHLLELFEVVGCGSVGQSRYMIYPLMNATEIFGPGSEADLGGVVLVGDDFSGQHEAYDTKDGWRFGTVGSSGEFEPDTVYGDFVTFIERWFVEE